MGLKGREATIIGAGVAGLAAACALAQAGARVTVYERAPQLEPIGAGLQISPNGHVVLRALGLEAALESQAIRAQAVQLRDGLSNKIITNLDMGAMRPDQGWYFIQRSQLISILAKAAQAAGVEIVFGHGVGSIFLDGKAPQVVFDNGKIIEPQLLIGADGLHSKLRHALCPQSQAFFTGQVAWRAVIAAQDDCAPVAEVHMAAHRHLVSYPLQGGKLRNIVAIEERAAWTEEGWSLRGEKAQLQAIFKDFSPRVRGWLDQIETPHVWGLHRHQVADIWGKDMSDAQVYLLGDGAHPTLPFLAQGANMALEDVWVLRDQLLAGKAAAEFGQARIARVNRIIDATQKNATNYHLRGLKRRVAHQILHWGGKIAPRFALSRFNWLYDYDVTKTSPS